MMINPIFLFGAGLIAIPVVIHLLNRYKPREIYFSYVNLLKEIDSEKKYRRRIREILLLLTRILMILVISLAFARPVLKENYVPGPPKDKPSHYIVLFDCSASMQYKSGKGSLLERAKTFIVKLKKNMLANDIMSIITFASKTNIVADKISKKEDIENVIDNIGIEGGENNYYKAFLRADRHFTTVKNYNNILCLISDLQKYGFDMIKEIGKYKFEADNVQFKVVSVTDPEMYNHYIKKIETPDDIFYKNKETVFTVTTGFSGTDKFKPVNLDFFVNGIKVKSGKLENKTVSLPVTFDKEGINRCKIKLEPDPLLFDNIFEFNIPVINKIKVGLINESGNESNVYLEKALNPYKSSVKNNISVSKLDAEKTSEDFSKYDIIVWDGINEPELSTAEKIKDYIEGGGKFIIFPEEDINIQLYNIILNKKTGLLPFKIVDMEQGSFKIKKEKSFGKLLDYVDESFYDIEFNNMFRISSSAGFTVLYRFKNGNPFIIKKNIGKGRMYFINMINGKSNGVMVLHPFYPVFINQLITNLKKSAGKSIVKDLNKNIYSRESELVFSEENEIKNTVSTSSILKTGEKVNDVLTTQSRDKQNIWWYLLAAVSVLMVVEYVLAGRGLY